MRAGVSIAFADGFRGCRGGRFRRAADASSTHAIDQRGGAGAGLHQRQPGGSRGAGRDVRCLVCQGLAGDQQTGKRKHELQLVHGLGPPKMERLPSGLDESNAIIRECGEKDVFPSWRYARPSPREEKM